MLFQSVGSHYTLRQALAHAFRLGRRQHTSILERTLSDRYKGRATLFSRGRAALAEAVRVATGGEGAVVVNAFTCYSVVEAVQSAGCTVVYCDIDLSSLHYNGETLEQVLLDHPEVNAIIVQNTLGMPCDIEGIETVSRRHNVTIIEDLAHGAGLLYGDGREAGTVGDITMLSFGRDKLLDSINGGALVMRMPDKLAHVKQPVQQPRLRDQLRDRVYPLLAVAIRTGYPIGLGKYLLAIAYKLHIAVRSADGLLSTRVALPNWQAAQAYARFSALNGDLEARRKKRDSYHQQLVGMRLPEASLAASAAPIRIPVLSHRRDEIVAALKEKGYFFEDIWYDRPVSPARHYDKVGFDESLCPRATLAAKTIFNLPTHQLVDDAAIGEICAVVNRFAPDVKTEEAG